MALYVKASPSVILSSLRAICSSTSIKCTMNYAFSQRHFQSPNFSTSIAIADKDLVDANLVKVLKYEIKSAKSNLKTQVKTPTDTTYPFEYETNNCKSFTREFPDGEVITVSLSWYKSEGDKVVDVRKNNMKLPPGFPMHVTIWKPCREGESDKWLHFDVTVSEEDIIIHKYHFVHAGYGPKIQELDDQLQRYLSKYLEKRGIKSIASFLIHNKCAAKEAKEKHKLSFMKNLEKLIPK